MFCLRKISFCEKVRRFHTVLSPDALTGGGEAARRGAGPHSEDRSLPVPEGRADLCRGTVADGDIRKVCKLSETSVAWR